MNSRIAYVKISVREVDIFGEGHERHSELVGPFDPHVEPIQGEDWTKGQSFAAAKWLAEQGFVRVCSTYNWVLPQNGQSGGAPRILTGEPRNCVEDQRSRRRYVVATIETRHDLQLTPPAEAMTRNIFRRS